MVCASRADLTTPDLPPDHWAIGAARRAEALGLLESPLPAGRTLAVHVVGTALCTAADQAEARGAGVARLTRSWHARFVEEFPGLAPLLAGVTPRVERLETRAALEIRSHEGVAAPGMAEFPPDRTGALPRPDGTGVVAVGTVAMALGAHAGVLLEPSVGGGGIRLGRADLQLGAGAWVLGAGRQPVGYGWGRDGLVLSGSAPLDRVELKTERTVRLPGALRVVGPVGFQTFVSRLEEERHEREPYFWGGSLSVHPHPRVDLGVQRATMFGGNHPSGRVTPRNLLWTLIGRVAGIGFEDQVVSVQGRYRLPTEAVLPLTASLEWGAEDAAGAWWDVPGRVIGIETPSVPRVEALSLGFAHTFIGERCCGNPGWYRHWAFPGGWTWRDEPLGHRLGGQGREALLHAGLDLADARLRLDGALYGRRRGADNLYVPGRGRSAGFDARLRWRLLPGGELLLFGGREGGSGWSEHRLRAGLNLFF